MTCATPCEQCNRKGLPILFTRYAAAYSPRAEGMELLAAHTPGGQFQTNPGGVPLKTGRYVVRMLRTGFLYLCIERVGELEWKGYAVHPHGYLNEFPVMLPENAAPKVACARDARQANNSLVWLEDAKKVTALWYMFHPDPVDARHLKQELEPNRAKYMQRLNVAAWLGGNTQQKDSCEPLSLDKQVLEYAALRSESLQRLGNEQCFGLMGATPRERSWGSYDELRNGKHFVENAAGAVVGMAIGPHTVHVKQPAYAEAHGPRLEGIRKFLLDNNGAVVACEDAIGIAQELSLHHLSAAIPYMDWLKETDSNKVSNEWKDSASRSIQTIRAALEKQVISTYDGQTENLRDVHERMGEHYPGSDSPMPVRLPRPDGTYELISVQELNRRRREAIQKDIDTRVAERGEIEKKANEDALAKIAANCDMAAVHAFDALHQKQIEKRDKLLDRLADDLIVWLKADSFIDNALARYSETAPIESGDGMRCAGQLCAILLQLDNSSRGRDWYAALDTFTPGKKNLVWRMLSLNNAQVSQELVAALQRLADPLPVPGQAIEEAKDNARTQKAYADMVAALGSMSKTLSSAEKIEKEWQTVADGTAKPGQRIEALVKVGKAAKDSMAAVLFAAVVGKIKALAPSRMENAVAQGQALILARGLGIQAMAFLKQEQAAALERPLLRQANSIQRRIEARIREGGANSAMQELRIKHAVCAIAALSIFPAIGRADARRDMRTMTELAGALASVVGTLKEVRTDFYEKAFFKTVPDWAYKTHRAGVAAVTGDELLRLKGVAARYVAAGAVVVVVWDAVDCVVAIKERNKELAAAYVGRAMSGVVSIGGTLWSAGFHKVPIWLTRVNLITAIVSVALTAIIAGLKGKAWINWLNAQPFRHASSKKLPFVSEEKMMQGLAEAISEI
ncbi:T6SS effector BTH_I2691 family protein [Cupriavidus taiwanensis]|uniref:T6SS effector BTH_I2691 family protein n=1 Tax=Cupriavidus taiwanensis TaxID=164546 RepID=UPI000E10B3BB|nr:T6SS effector BTH_I2691 family protein [Cupriavidus taiwanensis]SPA56467.1 Conserved hypothethical protein [Cupriavidus taiwanensis]